jgi:hypothetical protein
VHTGKGDLPPRSPPEEPREESQRERTPPQEVDLRSRRRTSVPSTVSSSSSKTVRRSSLRHLLTSTSPPKTMQSAIQDVQKRIESLHVRNTTSPVRVDGFSENPGARKSLSGGRVRGAIEGEETGDRVQRRSSLGERTPLLRSIEAQLAQMRDSPILPPKESLALQSESTSRRESLGLYPLRQFLSHKEPSPPPSQEKLPQRTSPPLSSQPLHPVPTQPTPAHVREPSPPKSQPRLNVSPELPIQQPQRAVLQSIPIPQPASTEIQPPPKLRIPDASPKKHLKATITVLPPENKISNTRSTPGLTPVSVSSAAVAPVKFTKSSPRQRIRFMR